MVKTYFILIAFFLTHQVASGQSHTPADSLKALLNLTQNPEEKIKLTLQLSEEFYKSDPTLALKYSNESEQLATKIYSDSLMNKVYLNQATAYLHLGNYPRALQLFFKAIHGAQKLDDSYTLFYAYEKLGILYYYQKDTINALNHFFEALKQFSLKKPENKKQIERKAYVLNNIGMIYDETKKYAESAQYLSEALTLGKQLNDHELMAAVLSNQGRLLHDQEKNDSALIRYKEALALRRKNDNKWGIMRSCLSMGQFYFNIKDYKTAETYLKEAIVLGTEIKSWENVNASSAILFQLYKQKKDYKNALNALDLNKKVNDSLYSEDKARKIGQLEMQFDFDRKQIEAQAKQREKDLYYLLGALGLGLSLIIVSLLYFLQKNKARNSQLEQAHLKLEKKNLEKDIELKDKELTTNVLHLMQKNKLIDAISEKLLKIKQSVGAESQPAVQKVVTDLQSNLQPELLQEFEFRFQQVHEEFYNILNERFSNLSPTERKLCAFLRLNMTTKEISAITHQSIKSIEIARTRLRKKLNLTGSDQNLVTFLIQLDSKNHV
ncbi:tetratricopeptide repeat protein [Solitalea koreensis]|uniref:Anaphase-promoting complex subunit 5 n=1 Tax=Solitalea koreensis TaxID=543615 RepID=A0A521DYU5_9SPHI|nr:tetratricopeptide repeat protein [Solitalea koreensis]SMO76805.1 Anaphase-promoting complex subunit 5 [Solitalea koreensis]